jgi:hypothetical protein
VKNELPNDNEVGNAGDNYVSTRNPSELSEIKKQEWSGNGPVDIAGPVDLVVDLVLGVWYMFAGVGLVDLVVDDAMAASHLKVGQSGARDDKGGEYVVETL